MGIKTSILTAVTGYVSAPLKRGGNILEAPEKIRVLKGPLILFIK